MLGWTLLGLYLIPCLSRSKNLSSTAEPQFHIRLWLASYSYTFKSALCKKKYVMTMINSYEKGSCHFCSYTKVPIYGLSLLAVVRDKQNMSSHSLSPLLKPKKSPKTFTALCVFYSTQENYRDIWTWKRNQGFMRLLGGKKFSAMGIESFVSK